MSEEAKKGISDAIKEEEGALSKGKSKWEDLWKKEDWWANWLGAFLLLAGLGFFLYSSPDNMKQIIADTQATMAAEQQRAPFPTIEYMEAERQLSGLQARKTPLGQKLGTLLQRPKRWDTAPGQAFILTKEAAAERRAAAQPRYEEAQQLRVQARDRAEAAQAAAEAANFTDPALNQVADEAIEAWGRALSAESRARSAANIQAYNVIPSMIVLMVLIALLFSVGMHFMGQKLGGFFIGFPFIFALSIVAYFIAGHSFSTQYGLSYVLWAVLLGLLISNTVGTPKWAKPAVQVEYYIKTGLVLLGGSILFGLILMIGAPGIVIAWGVTPAVLIIGYWVGDKFIKLPSKPLNVTIAAAASVCGVSAAIAAAAASKAKNEELTIAVGLSIAFTAVMMFAMPALVLALGMNPIVGGAWIGGTVDSTGAVVAAGELLGPGAMYTAATLKMIQNVMIGVIAFAIAAYWATRVETRAGNVKLTFGAAMKEIWVRFPKFVIGFIGASVVFTIIYELMATGVGEVIISDGALRGWANPLRGWLFCMAFVSIGLATNFRELAKYFEGGKILYHYAFSQGFNVVLTLVLAWLMFIVAFPGVTEHLMAIR
ncbi:YeiH family protein [Desulfurivibrio dismutans]|uniref:YeiH family protein n=1 Tax=Desulfurivibrio dismutans TaxID=1398908 RepID=UPI0023DA15F8|nr:putative sulfate exporter family transporter [Desulfurivibrio alkaliphilus]MDF1614506.1 putative sulfate exporter family transporter [Desulfurivibrio alkaliphilus]